MSDYIKREDAIKAVKAVWKAWNVPEEDDEDYLHDLGFGCGLITSTNILRDIPSADVVERKRGEWIKEMGVNECSECGAINLDIHRNFCPNCGADMRADRKE